MDFVETQRGSWLELRRRLAPGRTLDRVARHLGNTVAHRRATSRNPDQVRAWYLECAQQLEELVGATLWLIGWWGSAESLHVIADDSVALGERRHVIVPLATVGNGSMDQHQ